MNCFNHNGASAIGICKHCSKAICHDCCSDTGVGLACAESCESEVEAIGCLISRNIATTASQSKDAFLFPGFFGAIGVLFVVYGLANDGVLGFASVMGIGFLIFGTMYALRVRAWLRRADAAQG